LQKAEAPKEFADFQEKQREMFQKQRRNQRDAIQFLHEYRADEKLVLSQTPTRRRASEGSRNFMKSPAVHSSPNAYATLAEMDRLFLEQRDFKHTRQTEQTLAIENLHTYRPEATGRTETECLGEMKANQCIAFFGPGGSTPTKRQCRIQRQTAIGETITAPIIFDEICKAFEELTKEAAQIPLPVSPKADSKDKLDIKGHREDLCIPHDGQLSFASRLDNESRSLLHATSIVKGSLEAVYETRIPRDKTDEYDATDLVLVQRDDDDPKSPEQPSEKPSPLKPSALPRDDDGHETTKVSANRDDRNEAVANDAEGNDSATLLQPIEGAGDDTELLNNGDRSITPSNPVPSQPKRRRKKKKQKESVGYFSMSSVFVGRRLYSR
jgi:hypothetical protein